MPAYNAEKFIREAIDSIINQTYSNWELLIADDHSVDKTLDIIKSFNDSRIIVYENKENKGYLKTCNILFQEVSGVLITFQDADDFSYPTRIEKQVQRFLIDEELGMCGVGTKTEVTIDKLIKEFKVPESFQEVQQQVRERKMLPYCGATIMIKKEVLAKVGPYREFFSRIGAEDIDWGFRIVENFKSENVNESLYFYRFNERSFTKTPGSILKRHGLRLALYLHEQRVQNGFDELQKGTQEQLDLYIKKLLKPYEKDPSLFFFESALDCYHQRDFKKALKFILNSLQKNISIRNALLLSNTLLRLCIPKAVWLYKNKRN